ncbi:RDD family protein [Peterkaempfera griseoplana]|uniref:RDD family protein n=1 Tax=Peterkaempfera griseoplana TaxID=66896 RepID=UPI0006E12859|nr:RDD family protein [Peterkaempfera griseoplana]
MSDLVTGEAVVLGVQPAKLPSRMIACALDLLVLFVVVIGLTLVLALSAPDLDSAAAAAATLCLMVGILVGIPVVVETLSRGRSLGKLALGLRVVRTDGGPVRFRHALVRGLVGFFEIIALAGVPATISSMVSDRGRRLGDVFAGTLVVRERVPGAGGGRSPLPPLPPQLMHALGGELASLDLSAVPDGLWLAVRQYLGRMQQLDPQVSWNLAQQLAADLVTRTGRPAPEGLHPAAYLGAVLAERQQREWRQMTAHQQSAQAFPTPAPAGPALHGHRWAAAPVAAPAPVPAPPTAPALPSPVPQAAPQAAPLAPQPVAAEQAVPVDGGADRHGGFAPPA